MSEKIFVAIASFLDPEIIHTVQDCITKANNPDLLEFGVCLQYDNSNEFLNENILDHLSAESNILVDKYHYEESKGGCWARHKAQQLYRNQTFHLQVDSHTRFVNNWDLKCKELINNLKKEVNKPYISFLPPSYFSDNITFEAIDFVHKDKPNRINIPKIKYMSQEYWIDYSGYDNEVDLSEPLNIPVLYGGFIFSEGQWIVEIEQDPEHYYTGEEFALAIRSFTHGYDCFLPNEILAWHKGNGFDTPKHFTKLSDGKEEHKKAITKLFKLINGEDLGKYGLGNVRTLEEYGKFAGLDFEAKKVINV